MSTQHGFAIWITGLPASGKTSITRELVLKLEAQGLRVVTLESDELRTILTPQPTYRDEERDWFYHALASLGALITRSKVNVVFDATANKRSYRDYARSIIPRFFEVYVQCPLEICMQRDPKGIYLAGTEGAAAFVPGLQTPYEPPLNPEATLDGQALPEASAATIYRMLQRSPYR
jgi:adenylylsulfate kinase